MLTTPFNGNYINFGVDGIEDAPYTVTVVDNEDGTITISDLTGGLYGKFYVDELPNVAVTDLPATVTLVEEKDDNGNITITFELEDIPEDPAMAEAYGDGDFDITNGTIDEDGVITFTFTGSAGDSGDVILTKI